MFANKPGGGFVGYFPTALAAPNKSFLELYPGGVLPELAGPEPGADDRGPLL